MSKKSIINVFDLGRMEYSQTWDLQKKYFNKLLNQKKIAETTENYIFLVEHEHVYTIGKSGERANLLISNEKLKEIGASFIPIDRGGDITYHGPGQIVIYPIFDLDNFNIRTREFVYRLETAIIELLEYYKVKSSRMDSAAGVWIDADNSKARKICSIGIKSSRGATMHGIALNVTTDLSYFSYINPCGFVDKGMTSLQREFSGVINIEELKMKLVMQFSKVFSSVIVTKGKVDNSFPSC